MDTDSSDTTSSSTASWGGCTPLRASAFACWVLSYVPGSQRAIRAKSSSLARCRFSAQPASEEARRMRLATRMPRLSIRCPPLCPVGQSKIHQPLQQLVIRYSGGGGRFREILRSFEVGVGVRFEHVHLPFLGHPEVHAGVTREAER